MGSRRALTDIKNLVEAAPYPCAVAKKPTLQ
jgi:cyclin B